MAPMVCKLPSLIPSSSAALSLQSPSLSSLMKVNSLESTSATFSHNSENMQLGQSFPLLSREKQGKAKGEPHSVYFPPPGQAPEPEIQQRVRKRKLFLMDDDTSSVSLQTSPTALSIVSQLLFSPTHLPNSLKKSDD